MPPLYTISRCYNIWAICAVLQLASVAKSVLADKDELSQADITAMAASNFFVARMVGSDSPFRTPSWPLWLRDMPCAAVPPS